MRGTCVSTMRVWVHWPGIVAARGRSLALAQQARETRAAAEEGHASSATGQRGRTRPGQCALTTGRLTFATHALGSAARNAAVLLLLLVWSSPSKSKFRGSQRPPVRADDMTHRQKEKGET